MFQRRYAEFSFLHLMMMMIVGSDRTNCRSHILHLTLLLRRKLVNSNIGIVTEKLKNKKDTTYGDSDYHIFYVTDNFHPSK